MCQSSVTSIVVPTDAMYQDQNENANTPATNETWEGPNGNADTLENERLQEQNENADSTTGNPDNNEEIKNETVQGQEESTNPPTNETTHDQDVNADSTNTIDKLAATNVTLQHQEDNVDAPTNEIAHDQDVNADSTNTIGNPNSSNDNDTPVTGIDKESSKNATMQGQQENANAARNEPLQGQNENGDSAVGNHGSSDNNGSAVIHIDKPAATNVTPQHQEDNADVSTNKMHQDQEGNVDTVPTGEPMQDADADTTAGGSISPDDNVSLDTLLDKSIPTNEIQQDRERNADLEKDESDETQYKYLVERFNFKAVISIFACGLVVAYITFVNNAVRTISRIHYAHGSPYSIFLFLAYLSISLHALSGIISSRGAVLCSDPNSIKEKKYTIDEFKDTLHLCQHLTLHGIILFSLAVFGSSFFVFEDNAYLAMFCGVPIVVVVLLLKGKYKILSLIQKDITQIWNGIRDASWIGVELDNLF